MWDKTCLLGSFVAFVTEQRPVMKIITGTETSLFTFGFSFCNLMHSLFALKMAKRRSIIAITLLTLFLVANTEFHELLRLPVLVTHFFEHRESRNMPSLFEFLMLHYMGEAKDDQAHSNLPFNDHDYSLVTVLIINGACACLSQAKRVQVETVVTPLAGFAATASVNLIWRPPQYLS